MTATDGAPVAGTVGGARYRRILRFAAAVLVRTWWFELVLPRFGLARIAERGREARLRRLAVRFHALAVSLGGLMIKVGQFLSSRLDVLPPEITRELEGLQDEVPPVPFPAVRDALEEALGMPLDRAYAALDPVPVAAASLGQAHRARLHPDIAADVGFDGVVVKVQRPGIQEVVAVDLAALRRIAGWLRRIRIVADRVDAPALVAEFARTSLEEIDYLHEAGAAERFAADAADDPRVGVPAVVWERTTRRVLTLADVTALKITDVAGLRAAGIDPAEVASTFADVMFRQLFRHGFFHADPHPGNLFVTPVADGRAGPAWRLTFVDFGMMGEAGPELRRGLRRVVIAAAARDGAGVVAAIEDLGVLLPGADTRRLEVAMTELFGRFGGMGFAELRDVDPREFRDFAAQFRDVVRELPFQLPEDFLLIIRSMSLVSGVCSSLDPGFNVWDAVEPFAADLLRDEQGGMLRDAAAQAAETMAVTARLPRRIDTVITSIEEGRVRVDLGGLERRVSRLEGLARRILSALLFAALLIGGILLRLQDPVGGAVLMALSALPLLHALFAGVGRRR
ncbi:ABC1 kinase family protein [Microbacterium sp. GXF7504]